MSGRSDWMRAMACSPSPTVSTWMSSPEKVSSTTRWMVTLSSASSSLCIYARPRIAGDEVDNLLHGGAGEEDAANADLVQPGNVRVGDDAADHYQHVVQPFLAQQIHDTRADVHVRARQYREPD